MKFKLQWREMDKEVYKVTDSSRNNEVIRGAWNKALVEKGSP